MRFVSQAGIGLVQRRGLVYFGRTRIGQAKLVQTKLVAFKLVAQIGNLICRYNKPSKFSSYLSKQAVEWQCGTQP